MKTQEIIDVLDADPNAVLAMTPDRFSTTVIRVRGVKQAPRGLWLCTDVTDPITGEWRTNVAATVRPRDLCPVDEAASVVRRRLNEQAEAARLHGIAEDTAAALRARGINARRSFSNVIMMPSSCLRSCGVSMRSPLSWEEQRAIVAAADERERRIIDCCRTDPVTYLRRVPDAQEGA